MVWRGGSRVAETSGPKWAEGRRRRVRALLIALAIGIVVSQWVRIVMRPEGDFTLHWIFGWRFRLGGFLYVSGMHRPYPPFWAMASAPLSLLPMATMRAILYPLGLLPLAAVVVMLHRLSGRHLPLPRGRDGLFWATALALGLASRFLIRELPECGANLMMVALAWGGVYLWVKGRDVAGGLSLGLAIALKCTPALLAAYFAWKRQWRLVGVATAAAGLFTVAPALWMGPTAYESHMRYWISTIRVGASEPSPLQGVLGDEELWNLSLRPALGRYLVAVPSTHKGHIDHPWRVQVLDLDPALAGWIVKGAMLALVVGVAVVLGRRIGPRGGLSVLWECAALSILMLLLSPITWRQHGVWSIPAMVLIARLAVARGRLPRPMFRLLAVYALLVLGLDRGVIGRDLTLLLDSYGVTALALLCLLGATLHGRAMAVREEQRVQDAAGERHASGTPQPHFATGAGGSKPDLQDAHSARPDVPPR